MKSSKVNFTIIKEDIGYSASAKIGNFYIATEGENYNDLKNNILEALNLTFEGKKKYTFNEISYTLDIPSLFEFYKVINAKALSQRISINQSLLAQYISGKKKPSVKQRERIIKGVHDLGKELSEVNLLLH